ncbi:MAG TPA: DUF1844 domain-containing protein [Pyrinomonadaceae bacterium]|jgi:hypothetical protein
MIGKDESNEEVVFKVNDRRKFNADGSLREGVEIVPEKPKEETKPVSPPAETASETSTPPAADAAHAAEFENFEETETGGESFDDLPGADDPASFVNFLSTLATNAAAALGAMPHPVTGQRSLDLETGKYWVDVLAMLKEKTKNNLHPKEQELFDSILGDLRMQYVQMMRIAEEKLKQQAAQKFSASDILGKK